MAKKRTTRKTTATRKAATPKKKAPQAPVSGSNGERIKLDVSIMEAQAILKGLESIALPMNHPLFPHIHNTYNRLGPEVKAAAEKLKAQQEPKT